MMHIMVHIKNTAFTKHTEHLYASIWQQRQEHYTAEIHYVE